VSPKRVHYPFGLVRPNPPMLRSLPWDPHAHKQASEVTQLDPRNPSLASDLPPSFDGGRHQPTSDRPWDSKGHLFMVFIVAIGVLGVVLGVVIVERGGAQGPPSSAAASQTSTTLPGSRLTPTQIEEIAGNFARPSTPGAPQATIPVTAPTTNPTTTPPTTPSTPATNPPTSPTSGSSGYMNGVQTYAVGQTGTLWDPDKMVPLATITFSAPQFATTDGSGHTPQYGYFATFTVTVTDIAPATSADTINPSDADYYVLANGIGYGYGQTHIGNTAQAEGSNYLGSAVSGGLTPGQSTSGTVTVDVPSQHGSFVYAPNGTALGAWTF
jgi:hypothetical protein